MIRCSIDWACATLAALLLASAGTAAGQGTAPPVIEQFGLEEAQEPVRERPGWRRPERILVGGYASQIADVLRSAAPGVEFVVAGNADAARKAADVDAVIGLCTPEVLAAGRSIRWVQLAVAGAEDCISIPAVRERGILVTNMQRIGGPIIAEHAIAMMFALTRGLDLYVAAQPKGEWRGVSRPGRMAVVKGKTLLVVGLGGIGSEVAQRAHALGMKVIATRASSRSGPEFVSYVGLPDELHALAAQADVVINTVPLTAETTGIFDAPFFARMKPSAFFINVARGGSVVTAALADALRSGAIAGAGLDVTDPEPLPAGHPLWKMPNVIITPHVANASDLGFEAQVAVVRENLRRYLAGERMLSVVDAARGY